jgi:hypothetical protein
MSLNILLKVLKNRQLTDYYTKLKDGRRNNKVTYDTVCHVSLRLVYLNGKINTQLIYYKHSVKKFLTKS